METSTKEQRAARNNATRWTAPQAGATVADLQWLLARKNATGIEAKYVEARENLLRLGRIEADKGTARPGFARTNLAVVDLSAGLSDYDVERMAAPALHTRAA